MPVIEHTKFKGDPVIHTPRIPWWEGIHNIAKVLERVKYQETNPEFLRPHLLEISTDIFTAVPSMPAVDIRFVRALPPEDQTTGLLKHETWPLVYSVRYFHAIVDNRLRTTEAVKNFYALQDLLKTYNDLNDWTGSRRSKIEGVNMDATLFGEGRRADWVYGGALVLTAYVTVRYRYNDNRSPREATFATPR